MDKDKQIRKVPRLSLERLKRHSEFLTRGLEDLKALEVDRNIADNLPQQAEKNNTRQKEIIQEIWKRFEGASNTESILTEKAIALAVILNQCIAHDIAAFVKHNGTEQGSKDIEQRKIEDYELYIEIASVYFDFVEAFFESSISVLDDEDKVFLLSTLVIHSLAHAQPSQFEKAKFDFAERTRGYSDLPFYVQEGNTKTSGQGTVLWVFAENVRRITGKGKDVISDEMISEMILSTVNNLQLETLSL